MSNDTGGRRVRDCMLVGFTTTYAIGVYHYYSCEFEPRSWRGVLDTTLCDKVCFDSLILRRLLFIFMHILLPQ
jgi:hypothetical protein